MYIYIYYNIYSIIYTSPSGDADYFPGSPVPKNNLEITDLIRFAHAKPCVPSNPGKQFWFKICRKHFKIILETSGHRKVMFMGGEFTGTYMYVKPQEKNAP